MALMLSLCAFGCLIDEFRSRELRRQIAALLGVELEQYSASQMSYDLRCCARGSSAEWLAVNVAI